jgi:hypothetical protein
MATRLTEADARQSLNAHVAENGAEVFQKYGPPLGWNELQRLMADRSYVRYPCRIVFDAAPLQAGEFAHPVAQGQRPEDGFTMCVHPFFKSQLHQVPYLVLYQLVLVNYGGFATPDDAETFAASALGLPKDEYYHVLCGLADQLVGCGCDQA